MVNVNILDLVADGQYVKRSGSTLVGDTPDGGGAVDSVNGQTGVVNLTAANIPATPREGLSGDDVDEQLGQAESLLQSLSTDVGALNDNLDAVAVTANAAFTPGDQVELTDSDADVFGSFRIHADGTATSGWPERFVAWMETSTDSNVWRRTFYLNEYGEGRISPARSNTVPFRVFQKELSGDPARNMSVALIEVMDNRDDRNVLFQVMPDGSVVTEGDVMATGDISAANHIAHHPTILDHDDSAAGIADGVIYFRTPAP